MKLNTIINRYIIKEISIPLLISLVFFSLLFLMAQMLKIIELLVNYSVDLLSILKLLVFSSPFFLLFVIPMSIMLSILLAFLRMSSDNEIIALKSSGVNVYRFIPPTLIFCVLGWAFTTFVSVYGISWGREAVRELTVRIIASNLDAGLKERTFIGSFSKVMLYINKIDVKKRELKDIFIEDRRTKGTTSMVIAPRGTLQSEPDQFVLNLRLYNGMINQVGFNSQSANTIYFDVYDLKLHLKKRIYRKETRKYTKDMSFPKLREFLKKADKKDKGYQKALVEYHKTFSIPFACLALGFLAIPLGIQSRAMKKSSGLIIGLFSFLVYYLILSAGVAFGETGFYPPSIGIWMPNIIMGAYGAYLMKQTADERTVRLNFLRPVGKLFRRWLRSKGIKKLRSRFRI